MAGKKLFVGNLSFSIGDEELANFFAQAGNVEQARVVVDRETGKKKGFGFVTMVTEEEAQAAIDQLNGKDLSGRNVTVAEAREGGGGGGGGNRGPRGPRRFDGPPRHSGGGGGGYGGDRGHRGGGGGEYRGGGGGRGGSNGGSRNRRERA